MKQHQALIEKLNGFLSEEFEVDPELMTPDADVKKVLGLDSLDYIDLVVVIENNFSFKVKPEDFTQIISFRDFHHYIISRVQSKETSDAFVAGQIPG